MIDPNGLISKFFKSANKALQKGKVIQKLKKIENKAWNNNNANKALFINSMVKGLQKKAIGDLLEAIKNAPPGTTISGLPPTTNPDLAIEILKEILDILEEEEKNSGACKP